MNHAPISLPRMQQILLCAGVIALANSLAMVWAYGASMSTKHAIGLVIVDIIGVLAFVMAGFMSSADAKGAARFANGIGAVALAIAFFSHLGYTIGMRTENIATATAQTQAVKLRTKGVENQQELLDVMRKQLTDLREQNAWSGAVTADALRQKVAVYEEDVRQEEARKGCKSKCLAKMGKLAELKGQIATLEKADDLTTRIAATERAIATASEATIATKVDASPVRAQTEFVPQIYNLLTGAETDEILNPNAVQMSITGIIIGFLIAVASTGSAPALFWLAFWGAAAPAREAVAPVDAKPRAAAPAGSWGFVLPSAPSMLAMHGNGAA